MPILNPTGSLLSGGPGALSGPFHLGPSSRVHGEVDLVLEACVVTLGEERRRFGAGPAEVVDPRFLALREVAQHVVVHEVLVARVADAHADPTVVVAALRRNRAQPVVAGI